MIAVLGATGRIGRHVAEALADQPVEARALVRRPEAASVPLPAVRADLLRRLGQDDAARAAYHAATEATQLEPLRRLYARRLAEMERKG